MTIRKIILMTGIALCLLNLQLRAEESHQPAGNAAQPGKTSTTEQDSTPQEGERKDDVVIHVATVKFAQISGNYVYMQVDEDGKEVWVATMPSLLKAKVSPGDRVEYSHEITMKDFESRAMGKKFDTILFVTKIRVLEKEMPEDEYHKSVSNEERTITAPAPGDVEKAPEGKTIAEIFSEPGALKDKEVILRARIMKVRKNILKRTWLTLQDGTGTEPDDILHATTTENPTPGDTVILKGILRTDINLGERYEYKVLIEDAKILSE